MSLQEKGSEPELISLTDLATYLGQITESPAEEYLAKLITFVWVGLFERELYLVEGSAGGDPRRPLQVSREELRQIAARMTDNPKLRDLAWAMQAPGNPNRLLLEEAYWKLASARPEAFSGSFADSWLTKLHITHEAAAEWRDKHASRPEAEGPFWALCQAMTWIGYGQPMLPNEYTREDTPHHLGLDRVTFDARMTAAKRMLTARLQDGSITAYGFRLGSGRAEQIPAVDFLSPVSLQPWRDALLPEPSFGADPRQDAPLGTGIRMLKEQVISSCSTLAASQHHAEAGEAGSRGRRTARKRRFSPAALERCYRAYVQRCVSDSRMPSRQDDVEAMRRELGWAPQQAVWQLRSRLAPAEWKKQGRRKSVRKRSGDNLTV